MWPASAAQYYVYTYLGNGNVGDSGDGGLATAATINNTVGIARDTTNNILYFADQYNNKVRKVSMATGIVTTFAGSTSSGSSGDTGLATSATLYQPSALLLDTANSKLYISDEGNSRVRVVSTSSFVITTFAGGGTVNLANGATGFATNVVLNKPRGMCISTESSTNYLYINEFNNRIRKVAIATGVTINIAGTGTGGYSGDGGFATSAQLKQPNACILDSGSTNLYVMDAGNNRIRKIVVSTGIISTIAGTSTSNTFSGDGGPASSAGLSLTPAGGTLAFDSDFSTLYLSDANNARIRYITMSDGYIYSLIGGREQPGYNGDGIQATSTYLNKPYTFTWDEFQTVPCYFVDSGNDRIRYLSEVGPTGQPTRQPSAQPSCQPTGQPSTQPSGQPTTQPSGQPTRQPSTQPSGQPTRQPSAQPSGQPSSKPSGQPTRHPSSKPSGQPTSQPSSKPSGQPTSKPSGQPTTQPSSKPSGQPSSKPSGQPSTQPTSNPTTLIPTGQPTNQPSTQPSSQPTMQPSGKPSGRPSSQPSGQPSSQPSSQPSNQPSNEPSSQPTNQPTSPPSAQPSCKPSSLPSAQPTSSPSTKIPTGQPTNQPSSQPSRQPSSQPSSQPTNQPSSQPSRQPSSQPTTQPSRQPSSQPSSQPTNQPSSQPSRQPTDQPTSQPSRQPSSQPSRQPTSQPSSRPSRLPTSQPSRQPTMQPTGQPSAQPTSIPTHPSSMPTGQPSTSPSRIPTSQPSRQPSRQPTGQPSTTPTTPLTSVICLWYYMELSGVTETQFYSDITEDAFTNIVANYFTSLADDVDGLLFNYRAVVIDVVTVARRLLRKKKNKGQQRAVSTSVIDVVFQLQFSSSQDYLPDSTTTSSMSSTLTSSFASVAAEMSAISGLAISTSDVVTIQLYNVTFLEYLHTPFPSGQPTGQPSSSPSSAPTSPAEYTNSLYAGYAFLGLSVLIFGFFFGTGELWDSYNHDKFKKKDSGTNCDYQEIVAGYIGRVFSVQPNGLFSNSSVTTRVVTELSRNHALCKLLHRPQYKPYKIFSSTKVSLDEGIEPVANDQAKNSSIVTCLTNLFKDVVTTDMSAEWSRFLISLQMFTNISISFTVIMALYYAQYPYYDTTLGVCPAFDTESGCVGYVTSLFQTIQYCRWDAAVLACTRNPDRYELNQASFWLTLLLATVLSAPLHTAISYIFDILGAPEADAFNTFYLQDAFDDRKKIVDHASQVRTHSLTHSLTHLLTHSLAR